MIFAALLSGCTGTSEPKRNGTEKRSPAPTLGAPGIIDRSSLDAPASQPLKPGILVTEPGRAVFHISLSGDHLVWEAGGIESEKIPVLRQQDLRTGRVITLATDVLPDYGVAATDGRVFYASQAPSGRVRLASVRYDGSAPEILSRYLAAPIAARGNTIGWAEVVGPRFQVVVRDAIRGVNWLAADFPRCSGEGCYRIDAVTLADRGIVFDLGAVGPQPSRVVRRAFDAVRPSQVRLPNDAQPDLVPSSAGALYYWFNHGWYRWNFAENQPNPTRYQGATPAPLVRFDVGHFFLIESKAGCQSAVRAEPKHGAGIVLQRSNRISHLVDRGRHGCPRLTDLSWSGDQVTTAWAVESPKEENEHEDSGLVGVVVGASRTPLSQ